MATVDDLRGFTHNYDTMSAVDINDAADAQIDSENQARSDYYDELAIDSNVDEEKLQNYLDKKPTKEKHEDTGAMNRAWNNVVDSLTWGDVEQSLRTDEYKDGRKWDSRNKNPGIYSDYSEQELVDELKTVKDDPSASHVFYNLRYQIGTNDDGSPKYAYKNGIDKVGAYNRYKNQMGTSVEILQEKRFAGAEDFEGRLNQIAFEKKYSLIDNGDEKEAGLNFGSGYTELLTKDIFGLDHGQKKDEIKNNLSDSYDKYQEDVEYRSTHNSNNSLWEMAKGGDYTDALEYGAINTLAGLGDMLAGGASWVGEDVLGIKNNLDKNNWFQRKLDNADKISGYDVKAFQQAITESTNLVKKGNTAQAILGIGANIPTLAEGIFSSAPEMSLYAIGAGEVIAGSKIARGLLNAKSALATAEKAGKTAEVAKLSSKVLALEAEAAAAGKTGAYIAKLSEDSRLLNTMANGLKVSGFDVAVMSATNRIVDDRKANGDEDVTVGEFAAILGSQYVLLGMDKFSVTSILKDSGVIKKSLSESFNAMTRQGKLGAISKLGKEAGLLAKASGMEAAQEYIQTWGEIFGKDLGVNGKTASDVLSDEKNQDEALGASIAGGVAGGGMHNMGTVASAVMTKTVGYVDSRKDIKSLRATTSEAIKIKKPEDFKNEEQPLDNKVLSVALALDPKEDHQIDASFSEAIKTISQEKLNDVQVSTIAYGLAGRAKTTTSVEEFKDIVSSIDSLNDSSSSYVSSRLLSGITNSVQKEIDSIKKDMGSIFFSNGNEITDRTRKRGEALDGEKGIEKAKNPFFGKFDSQIVDMSKKIQIKSESGLDTKDDVVYLNKLKEINSNSDYIEKKTFEQATNEISTIGYTVGGRAVKGFESLEAYKISIPASINLGKTNELKNINRFAGSRQKKFNTIDDVFNGRPVNIPTSKYVIEMSKENMEMRQIISNAVLDIEANTYIDESIKRDMLAELTEATEYLDLADESYGDKVSGRVASKLSLETRAPNTTEYVPQDIFEQILSVYSDSKKIRELINDNSQDKVLFLSPEQSRELQKRNIGEPRTSEDNKTDAFVAEVKSSQRENGAIDTIIDEEMDKISTMILNTKPGKALDFILDNVSTLLLTDDQIKTLKTTLDKIKDDGEDISVSSSRTRDDLEDLHKRVTALKKLIEKDSKNIDSKDISDAFEFAKEEMNSLSDSIVEMMNEESNLEKISLLKDSDNNIFEIVAAKAIKILSELAKKIFKAKAEKSEIVKFQSKLGKYRNVISNKGMVPKGSKKPLLGTLDQTLAFIQKRIDHSSDTNDKTPARQYEPSVTKEDYYDENINAKEVPKNTVGSKNSENQKKETDDNSSSNTDKTGNSSTGKADDNNVDSDTNSNSNTDIDSIVERTKKIKGMPQTLSNEAYAIIDSMIKNKNEGCK